MDPRVSSFTPATTSISASRAGFSGPDSFSQKRKKDPVLTYLKSVDEERSQQMITILISELRPRRWWQTMLHSRWSEQLRSELKDRTDVTVVASFEWPLKR